LPIFKTLQALTLLHHPTTTKKRLKSAFKAVTGLFFDVWQTLKVHQQGHRQQKGRFRHGLSHGQAAIQHAKSVPPIAQRFWPLQLLTHCQCVPVPFFLVQNKRLPDPFYPAG
jgi:hypothetical protein